MVFVSPLSGSYGTLPGSGSPRISASRRIALLLVAAVVVASMCLSMVAFEMIHSHSDQTSLVQRVSDSFLFKTPTLKSLVGTFMTEQGASKNDISEVKDYFSSKKSAKVQMLEELSNGFQPVVTKGQEELAWKPAHEVVGAAFQPLVNAFATQQPEAVSEAAEDPVGPVIVSDELLPKSEVGLSDSMAPQPAFGTDEVYIGMGDGSGQSTKAQMEQLWNAAESDELDPSSGRRPFVRDERAFRKENDKWMKKMPSYWNKAPVQELFSMPQQFQDHKPRGSLPLLNPGAMGTNHAFLNRRSDGAGHSWYQGVGDGSGVSTKARLEALAQRPSRGPHAVQIPDAGEAGTDMAFLAEKTNPAGRSWLEGVGDGAGQSTADTREEALAARGVASA